MPKRSKTQGSPAKQKQPKNNSNTTNHAPVNITDINQFIAMIDTHRQQYEFNIALTKIQQALQKYPQNTVLLDLLGEVSMDSGNVQAAKQAFKKSIQLNPQDGYTKYMYLAQISEGKEAIQLFHKGIALLQQMKLSPEKYGIPLPKLQSLIADALCSIVEIYMTDLCMEPDAEQQCDKAIKQAMQEDPTQSHINIFQTMASFKLSQCKPEDAKQCMRKVFDLYEAMENETSEVEKPSYMFRLNSAKLLIEVDQYEMAETILDRLAVEFERVADVWFLLAICCRHQKDYASAAENATKALQLAREQQQTGEEDPEFTKAVEEEYKTCSKLLAENPPPPQDDDDVIDDDNASDWEDEDQEMHDN
jgi:predicted Zn-dependent protease